MTIYIFLLLFQGLYVCVCVCIQKPLNSIQHVSIGTVSWNDFFLSIHIMWEFTRYGLREKTELLILSFLFYVNWRWKGPAALFGQSRCFTAACMGGKLAFSSFPPL